MRCCGCPVGGGHSGSTSRHADHEHTECNEEAGGAESEAVAGRGAAAGGGERPRRRGPGRRARRWWRRPGVECWGQTGWRRDAVPGGTSTSRKPGWIAWDSIQGAGRRRAPGWSSTQARAAGEGELVEGEDSRLCPLSTETSALVQREPPDSCWRGQIAVPDGNAAAKPGGFGEHALVQPEAAGFILMPGSPVGGPGHELRGADVEARPGSGVPLTTRESLGL